MKIVRDAIKGNFFSPWNSISRAKIRFIERTDTCCSCRDPYTRDKWKKFLCCLHNVNLSSPLFEKTFTLRCFHGMYLIGIELRWYALKYLDIKVDFSIFFYSMFEVIKYPIQLFYCFFLFFSITNGQNITSKFSFRRSKYDPFLLERIGINGRIRFIYSNLFLRHIR